MIRKLFICISGLFISMSDLSGQPELATITRLEPATINRLDQLNSSYRETNPCMTPDGKFLFFMSGRGGEPWNIPDYTSYDGKTEADGDIFYSEIRDGKWAPPVNLGPDINTPMGEDEPNITPDGQFVIFQSWKEGWDTTGGPYYQSELSGNVWGKPRGLGGNIHQFFMDQIEKNDGYYATDGSSISPDGKMFIFACGKWYDEPMDLYISLKENGQWKYPQKMALSTFEDERSVFIAADSRTLFFSSSGYGGLGGLDIFKTILDEKGHHDRIIHLGSVFNTREDDFGLTMNATGTEIFYTVNADLIHVKLKNPDRLLKPLPSLLIQGVVTDYDGQPLEAEIRIVDKQERQTVTKAKSNAISGEYSLVVQKIKGTYVKEISAENFRKRMEEIEIRDEKESTRLESRDFLIRKNAELIFLTWMNPESGTQNM
jgi:hypothetical protein